MKYRVLATRSAASVCGLAKRYCSSNGEQLIFDDQRQASYYAQILRGNNTSPNVDYYPEPIDGRDNAT